jgi:hypothetical protein
MKAMYRPPRHKHAELVRVPLPRVVIAYPCGGSVTVPFMKSMVRLSVKLMERAEDQRNVTRVFECQSLYVSQNRNRAVRDFLANGNEEWLLQIDTDIEFGYDLVDKFLAVAAADPARRIIAANIRLGVHQHAGYALNGQVWTPMSALPDGDVIPVDAAATACFMVHRTVFEEIKAAGGGCWFNHIYVPGADGDPNEYIEIGEDLAFCQRARSLGIQTWLVKGMGLRHYKTTPLVEVTA